VSRDDASRRRFLGLRRRPREGPRLPDADPDETAAALAKLDPGRPAIRDKGRPAHLDQLLGGGNAEPADARGPGSQRGRRLPVLPVVRPPGAVPEAEFVERCDGCGACFDACPYGVIVPLDGRHGGVRGTPTLRGRDGPCRMCEDFPCVTACDRGALTAGAPTTIGVAQIRQFDCLAHAGSFCSTCVERCPADAIVTELGKPRIVDSACTGCGTCQHVCPAPRNAILIVAPPARLESE